MLPQYASSASGETMFTPGITRLFCTARPLRLSDAALLVFDTPMWSRAFRGATHHAHLHWGGS